jgi:GNAT superfamily N-acetyltransferase
VATSGHDYEERVLEILAAGAQDYVRKSRVGDDLVAAPRAALRVNTARMEIVELSADEVREAAGDLAQLLLDAHASNMSLGLAGPLTAEHAVEAWVDTAGRLDSRNRVLLAAVEDGVVVGTVQVVRAESENGGARAEVVRLAVRADRRGTGLGRRLLEAAVERARVLGLRLLWLTTHAGTDSDRFYEAVGWTRLGVLPAYSTRPDGTLVGAALFYREV